MTPSYIPSKDALVVAWGDNFQTVLATAYLAYGLGASDAAAITADYNTFSAAYTAATTPGTRTPTTVNAKDVARNNFVKTARTYAQIIQKNPVITEEQRATLGITIPKTNRTPVPAPSTSPLLSFIAATPLQHTLRASDQLTPDSRAKPFGALQLVLEVEIVAAGGTPTGIPTNIYVYTKVPMAVNFITNNVGKVAYYRAHWNTRTGLSGPTSTTLSATII